MKRCSRPTSPARSERVPEVVGLCGFGLPADEAGETVAVDRRQSRRPLAGRARRGRAGEALARAGARDPALPALDGDARLRTQGRRLVPGVEPGGARVARRAPRAANRVLVGERPRADRGAPGPHGVRRACRRLRACVAVAAGVGAADHRAARRPGRPGQNPAMCPARHDATQAGRPHLCGVAQVRPPARRGGRRREAVARAGRTGRRPHAPVLRPALLLSGRRRRAGPPRPRPPDPALRTHARTVPAARGRPAARRRGSGLAALSAAREYPGAARRTAPRQQNGEAAASKPPRRTDVAGPRAVP